MKTCTKCLESKPLMAFHRDRSRRDGRRDWCKLCVAEYQKSRDYDPRAQKRRSVKYKYGLTLSDYETLLAAGCAVCGSHDRVVMDHDHATGMVRSALCTPCNLALGNAADSPERLEALAIYLRTHGRS